MHRDLFSAEVDGKKAARPSSDISNVKRPIDVLYVGSNASLSASAIVVKHFLNNGRVPRLSCLNAVGPRTVLLAQHASYRIRPYSTHARNRDLAD